MGKSKASTGTKETGGKQAPSAGRAAQPNGQKGGASSKGASQKQQSGGGGQGAQLTGTTDEHYNLVSVLYHSLKGAQTYAQYIRDAEEAGDSELVEFFEDMQEEERMRSDRAKELLGRRLGGGGDDEGE
jgi:hypothetical protein